MGKIDDAVRQPEPSILATTLLGLRFGFSEHELNFSDLLVRHGIVLDQVKTPKSTISFNSYCACLSSAAAEANDPVLGLRLAGMAGPETLGAAVLHFLAARTLSEGVSLLPRLLRSVQNFGRAYVSEVDDEIQFHFDVKQRAQEGARHHVELVIALFCKLIRMYGGPSVDVSTVGFVHAPATGMVAYERLLGAPVRFEQETNWVRFSAAFGELSCWLLDGALSKKFRGFFDVELGGDQFHQSFSDQINELLAFGQIAPPITASKVSEACGISDATLYRRLKTEGTTFSDLVERHNFDLARHYLSDTSLSIGEITYLIGFSESASFTRAFARWTGGITPSSYRKQTRKPQSLQVPALASS